MEEKVDVKETKELLLALMKLGGLLYERFHDGFQPDDLPVLLSRLGYDSEFKEAMLGLNKVPRELSNLDMGESLELVMVVVKELPELLAKGKRPEPDSDL